MAIVTRFTDHYGIRHPLAQAGMGFAGEKPELALAVAQGGGMGSIGVGFMPAEELRKTIGVLRRGSDAPFNINFLSPFDNEEQVKVVAEEKVAVASFHWGHPPEAQLQILKDAGCDIWVQVGTVADGVRAVEYGASVIIAQGWEAGGHNYGGMGSMAFIPAMVDAVGKKAMVLGAGGISDARAAAATIALGADGVWVGTRLVASTEAHVNPEHHSRLIKAQGEDTTRSSVFGPEMPAFNPMRLLKVRPTNEFEGRLEDVPTERDNEPVIGKTIFLGKPYTKKRFDVMLPTPDTTGDWEEMPWLMGQGVGQVHDIRPAAELVAEMMDGAEEILSKLSAKLTSTKKRGVALDYC